MKYMLLLFLLISCGGKQRTAEEKECRRFEKEIEVSLFNSHTVEAKKTKVCELLGSSFYYISEDREYIFQKNCYPMPAVAKVKCFRNCSTKYIGCLVFHSDHYILSSVVKY